MNEVAASRPRIERALTVQLLRCPACGEASPQKLVTRERVRVFSTAEHPFVRAFGWTAGPDAPEESPLHHGLCLCPECHYPGLPADFRRGAPEPGGEHPCPIDLPRLFVDQQVGLRGPIAQILGPVPEVLPRARRAVRVTLAAIATRRLQPESPPRRLALARLHARLAWLYLDGERLDWKPGPRVEAPSVRPPEIAPVRAPDWRAALAAARATWSDIPLDEVAARDQAVRAQEALCAGAEGWEAESIVEERRRLALLLGLAGRTAEAAAAYERALDLCLEARLASQEACRAARRQGLGPAEVRPAAETAHRLGRLAEEIHLEARRACGIPERRIPRLRLPAALLGCDLEDLPRDLGLFG